MSCTHCHAPWSSPIFQMIYSCYLKTKKFGVEEPAQPASATFIVKCSAANSFCHVCNEGILKMLVFCLRSGQQGGCGKTQDSI